MKGDISPRGMIRGGQKRPIKEMTIEGQMIIGGQKRPIKEMIIEGQMIIGGQKRPIKEMIIEGQKRPIKKDTTPKNMKKEREKKR